jgi:hypothetical protein
MFHLSGPRSWTLLGLLRWAATGVVGLFCVAIAEDNVRYLAEEKHWNEYLSAAIKAAPDAAQLTGSHWFWLGSGVGIGIAFGLWLVKLSAPKRDDRATKRQLIRRARALALQQLPETDFRQVLEGSTLYHQLRPYLSDQFNQAVRNNVIVRPPDGSTIPGLQNRGQ